MIYDNPRDPFFKETWLIPFKTVGGPPYHLDAEHRLLMSRLLNQSHTYFLVINSKNEILTARKVEHDAKLRERILQISGHAARIEQMQLPHTSVFHAIIWYLNSVPLEQVKTEF